MRSNSKTKPDRFSVPRFEWQTWLLIIAVYGSWLSIIQNYAAMSPLVAIPLLIIVCALHGSMCHELIHGHPTRNNGLNDLLGSIPLMLFLPYPIYRESHLQHHRDESITLPGQDPESYFCSAAEYRNKSSLGKAMAWINMTVVGRLLFHPAIEIIGLVRHLARSFISLDFTGMRIWIVHLVSVALLLVLITQYFAVPLWHYLLIAYFGSSMVRIRSFYEHRPREKVAERSVLMEPNLFFRALFLNLNYHLPHHEHPQIPWYRLADYYHRNRDDMLERNGGFHYKGYRFWLLRHLFRPIDSPIHPFA